MIRLLLVSVLWLLMGASCETKPEVDQKPKDPIFVGTEVKVGVREECHVTIPTEPKWAVEAVAADAPAFEKSKAVLAEVEQRRDYQSQLRAAAKKCE
jgi:hypothetical protein